MNKPSRIEYLDTVFNIQYDGSSANIGKIKVKSRKSRKDGKIEYDRNKDMISSNVKIIFYGEWPVHTPEIEQELVKSLEARCGLTLMQ